MSIRKKELQGENLEHLLGNQPRLTDEYGLDKDDIITIDANCDNHLSREGTISIQL